MKKRVLALVLSTAMVSGILAGCGSSTGESSEPAASTEAAAETEAADTEEAAAETETAEAAEDAEIPSGVSIGKNAMVNGKTRAEDYPDGRLESGRTLNKEGDAV